MIAPSPDWFVGVSGLELFRDGLWRRQVTVELQAYDAGTDSGIDFVSPNEATQPARPIALLTGFPFQNGTPLGTFTFRLVCPNPPAGDLNGDYRVDTRDLAVLLANWLVDCNLTPNNPACQ
jgi:hypothetical protein